MSVASEEVEDGVEVGEGGDGGAIDGGKPKIDGGVVPGFLGWLGHSGVRLTGLYGIEVLNSTLAGGARFLVGLYAFWWECGRVSVGYLRLEGDSGGLIWVAFFLRCFQRCDELGASCSVY